jgi:hypothetical protein
MFRILGVSALFDLLSGTRGSSVDELGPYAAIVNPSFDRAEQLYQEWYARSGRFEEPERLANSASVHRWEAARIADALADIDPPRVVRRAHDEAIEAMIVASRAAQRLGAGARFHNAKALCEGQILLEESRERRLWAVDRMRATFERVARRSNGKLSLRPSSASGNGTAG